MFGTFRRHQKWIWILGVIVIIPSMVTFLTPDMEQSMGLRDFAAGGGTPYTIAGKPVTIAGRPVSYQAVSDAEKETVLSYFIRSGGREWPDLDDRLRRDALFRVFLVEKMADMDIVVSDSAVAQTARDRLGTYAYENFERDFLLPHNLTSLDFQRFCRHEAAMQQLLAAAGLNAQLITPSEAEFIYKQENQESQVDIVPFWTSNYLEQVQAPPEEVATFFTNNVGRYRIPDRIQVNYAAFEATNYFAKADQRFSEVQSNVLAQIDDIYYQRGTNSFLDTNGVALSEEAAKAQIKEMMRYQTALTFAHQAANEFGNELLGQANQNDAQNLDRLAAAKGFPILVTEPFSRFEGFETNNLPEEFRAAALKLTTNAPVLWNPIRGTNAVYVMAFKDRVPGRMQTFEEVQEKVLTNFKEAEASRMARSAATNFYAVLTNGMASGKTFPDIAAEQKVTVVEVASFSPSTTTVTNLDPRIELQRLQGMISRMQVGEVGPYTPTRDGAFIAYYRAKLPIDMARMEKELPDLASRLRAYRRTEAFNQWFSREAQKAPLTIPEPPEKTPPPGQPPRTMPIPPRS